MGINSGSVQSERAIGEREGRHLVQGVIGRKREKNAREERELEGIRRC